MSWELCVPEDLCSPPCLKHFVALSFIVLDKCNADTEEDLAPPVPWTWFGYSFCQEKEEKMYIFSLQILKLKPGSCRFWYFSLFSFQTTQTAAEKLLLVVFISVLVPSDYSPHIVRSWNYMPLKNAKLFTAEVWVSTLDFASEVS